LRSQSATTSALTSLGDLDSVTSAAALNLPSLATAATMKRGTVFDPCLVRGESIQEILSILAAACCNMAFKTPSRLAEAGMLVIGPVSSM
jgi:hypothetical protein